jgi:hypothetical protein
MKTFSKRKTIVTAEVLVCCVTGCVIGILGWIYFQQIIWKVLWVASCIACWGFVVGSFLRNKPSIILADTNVLEIKCRPIIAGKHSNAAVWVKVQLNDIEKIWIGRPKDYPSLLMSGFESRTYPNLRTLLLWRKGDSNPCFHRDFGFLSNTCELLNVLREKGVRIDG